MVPALLHDILTGTPPFKINSLFRFNTVYLYAGFSGIQVLKKMYAAP